MTDSQTRSANRRIVKNTAYMYVRLFTMMVIGLYTSRLVLEILGASDYGLFSVVGGVLAMFTFISGSLTSATSRFLNVEMGKKDGDVNRIFNINVLLHVLLACIILLLAESIGLWYIYNKLNVADGKLDDAVFVYQMSILTACLGIVNTPYQSLFIAHERFRFLAVLDIANSFVRLGCILLLSLYHGDYALRLYSIIFCLTTANSFVVFHWLAWRQWEGTVKFRLVRGWKNYKEVLVFGNWNMLSTVSYMARSSGSDLLLNSFFGTAVNGAFAISKTVSQCIGTFSRTFDSASSPQIIQGYAADDKARVTYLVNKIGRYGLLLFIFLYFPLNIELDYVLHLWLGKVPEGALEFTRLNLLVLGVSLSCGGLGPLLRAYGRIKWFQIELSFFFLICIPIGYVLFYLGYPPYTILVLFMLADLLHRIVQLVLFRLFVHLDSLLYVKEAYLRPAVIAVLLSALTLWYSQHPLETDAGRLTVIALTGVVTVLLIGCLGLTKQERKTFLSPFKHEN